MGLAFFVIKDKFYFSYLIYMLMDLHFNKNNNFYLSFTAIIKQN